MEDDFFINFEKKNSFLIKIFRIKHKLDIEKLENHLSNFKVLFA